MYMYHVCVVPMWAKYGHQIHETGVTGRYKVSSVKAVRAPGTGVTVHCDLCIMWMLEIRLRFNH